jgi:hypothetical protein
MEQEYTPNEQSKTKKIYVNRAIYVATIWEDHWLPVI